MERETIKLNPDDNVEIPIKDNDGILEADTKKLEEEKGLTPEQEMANEANALLANVVSILSEGVIEVYLLKPCRKGNIYKSGRLVSIITDLSNRKVKVKVAYNITRPMTVNGKKRQVPITDVTPISNISAFNIIDIQAAMKEETERLKNDKETKTKNDE